MKLLLCLLLFSTQAIVNSAPVIDFSELDKLVPTELKEKNTPGAVITVVSGDQVIYQKAFGVANVETNAVMQPEMLFRLGSPSTMSPAAALSAVPEQNRIKMPEPIGNRVKGLHHPHSGNGLKLSTGPHTCA